jgi:MOSC domain-containing protein YiiM
MVTGRVVSVNVGLPREVLWNKRSFTTGIFEEPVEDRVRLRRLGLDGDEQVDLTVHGGPEKAAYACPSEHYEYWRAEVGRHSLPWRMFGENLTTQGLLEDQVRVGDEFRIQSATLVVTQPRFPCYKLGIKFGTMEMVNRFQASGRSGFYLAVLQEGEIQAGDEIELIRRNTSSSHPTISEVFAAETREG